LWIREVVSINIFVLDREPRTAARYHCDSHASKMVLESAMMLSTALRVAGREWEFLYGASYQHHPCTRWAAETRENFNWLYRLARGLAAEFHLRNGGWHKSFREVISPMPECPPCLPSRRRTPFAQAMPEEYKHPDAVVAYRAYYRHVKREFATYSVRDRPAWLDEGMTDQTELPTNDE
jgi:hypothetical protein